MSGYWFNSNPDTRPCNQCGQAGHVNGPCPNATSNPATTSTTAQTTPSMTATTSTQTTNTGARAPGTSLSWASVAARGASTTLPTRTTQAPRPAPIPTAPPPAAAPQLGPVQTTTSTSAPGSTRAAVALPLSLRPNQLSASALVPASATTTAQITPSLNPTVPSFTSSNVVTAPTPTTTHGIDLSARLAEIGISIPPEMKSWDPIKQMNEFGLRHDHGTREDIPADQQKQKREVLTNYVKILKRPKFVYVYELKIVRNTGANGEEYLVKNKGDKKAIFDRLTQQPSFAPLRDHNDWVTDHDLIWATSPLFSISGNEEVTAHAIQFSDVDKPCHPHTGHLIQFESVHIRGVTTINASQTPLQLLRSSNASTDEADDGTIFIRGMNAFVTQYARETMSPETHTSTAANKFFITRRPHAQQLDRGNALRALRGFTVSTRPGVQDFYLNVHVGASPFLENVSVAQLLRNFNDMQMSPREAFIALRGKEALIRDPARPKGPHRRVIIESVGGAQLLDTMRTWSDLEMHTRPHGLRSLDVHVSPRGLTNSEPAEHVQISGVPSFRGALSPAQTKAMLGFACKLPIYNKKYIQDPGFTMLGIDTASAQQGASRFGISVESTLLKVPARWLSPPSLQYRNGVSPTGFAEASWNLQGLEFFKPSTTLRRVEILDLHRFYQWDKDEPKLHSLGRRLQQELHLQGLSQVQVVTARNADTLIARDTAFPDETRLIEYFQTLTLNRQSPTSVLVVLPQKSYDHYETVKRVTDLHMGRHAVCAVSVNIDKKCNGNIDKQYLANVGMKFNLKGSGSNHTVERGHLASILSTVAGSSECSTIIIGADVTHPSGSARPGCPSIAAVVGSTDDDYLHYPGSMRLQASKQEFIADLGDMVKERLIDWAEKHGGKLPSNMLFYRDGVSESQYKAVRESEIPQLNSAYRMAYKILRNQDLAPDFRLTFFIVGKRHNTRFFTDKTCQENTFLSDLSNKEAEDKVYPQLMKEEEQEFPYKLDKHGKEINNKWTRVNHNLLPGFVVDDVITHPYSNDFFLQSHKPLQGTGRSAHYFVLTNQLGLTSDQLQQVTHALCYIYARATKGVSYCAPAYYADRLCDRGRAWLRDFLIGRRGIDKLKNEKPEAFKMRALGQIDQGSHWRPDRSSTNPSDPGATQKYGGPRKNPWHPNLDDVMFYL